MMSREEERGSIRKIYTMDSWKERMKGVRIPTEWMNGLIMNYLTTEVRMSIQVVVVGLYLVCGLVFGLWACIWFVVARVEMVWLHFY